MQNFLLDNLATFTTTTLNTSSKTPLCQAEARWPPTPTYDLTTVVYVPLWVGQGWVKEKAGGG
eukprot:5913166-Amphidinium_carterae.1